MLHAAIIMVGIVVSVVVLSKADIKITINHNHKNLTPSAPVITQQHISQKELDDMLQKEQIPTFDDVLKVVQDAIGGVGDE